MMGSIQDDLRYAARFLVHHRVQTLATVLLLSLGIGGATAIFTVANAVLMRPLPYEDPARLVSIYASSPKLNVVSSPLSVPAFVDIQKQSKSFKNLGIYTIKEAEFQTPGDPRNLPFVQISPETLRALGVKPAMGRSFLPKESDRDLVALITHRLWATRFGSDKAAIGKKIEASERSYTIVGVLPEDFSFTAEADIFAPLDPTPSIWTPRGGGGRKFAVIARLGDNASLASAQADLDAITARLAKDYPKDEGGWQLRAMPLHRAIVGDMRLPLLLLIASAVCLLLAAGANVAGMLLVSALRQQREIALSGALGATPARILRQLALQGLLTAFLAGMLGCMFAAWGKTLLVSLIPRDLPLMDRIGFDWRVLSFALLITVVSGIIAGLLPALFSRNADMSQVLRESGSTSSVSSGTLRVRSVFVVAQIAIAVTLLSATTLVVRHLNNLLNKDLGFDPHSVLYIRSHIFFMRFREAHLGFDSIVAGLRKLPDVESASLISFLPTDETKYRGEERFPLEIEGRPPVPPPGLTVGTLQVEHEFFKTMRTPLVEGRTFQKIEPERSRESGAPAVINQAMARLYWPGVSAVGKYFTYIKFGKQRIRCVVIGVVGDIRGSGYGKEPVPVVYHNNWYYGTGWVVARTKTKPESLFGAVAKIVNADPNAKRGLLLDDIGTLEDLMRESIQAPRLVSFILTFFAGSSLLLALLGTYTVIAYSAAFRTREISIRQALGARPWDIFFLVLREGVLLSVSGAAVGVLLSCWAVRVAQSQVYGMADISLPGVLMCSTPVLFAFVAASLKPAFDAARIPESLALRDQ